MAKLLLIFTTQLFTISLLFLLSTTTAVAGENHEFVRTMDRKLFGLKKEKLSYFKLYWHDIVTGSNTSAVMVVPPWNTSKTAFGMVRKIDNPLTLGPEMSSKLVGKAQGFYAQAAQDEIGLLMATNFAFMEGKYNGSTITILGRNYVFFTVRDAGDRKKWTFPVC